MSLVVRLAEPDDAGAIACLYYETIHAVNSRDYTVEQVEAWAGPAIATPDQWRKRQDAKTVWVAIAEIGIAGFAELDPNGHIDCFYCHKNYQGRGAGKALYETLEKESLAKGFDRLFTEASITARPFFERCGFTVVKRQEVVCRGVAMINFAMEKSLRP